MTMWKEPGAHPRASSGHCPSVKPGNRSADHPSIMERRSDERYQVQFGARVTALGDRARSALGRVTNISNSGISVGLPFQLAAGEMVEIEIADSTLYGHVIYSRPDESLFHTGIEANRVALGATGVSSVLRRILTETLPGIPGLETTAVR